MRSERKSIQDLPTPSLLVDLDVLEINIHEMAALCEFHGIQLWPMVKTHKSSHIASFQSKHGAAGFLVGTLDEAEALAERGHTEIMLAYPTAGTPNVDRAVALAEKCRLIIAVDGTEAAQQIDGALLRASVRADCLIIIDCGLHRFGVPADEVGGLREKLDDFHALSVIGIATHPGHVYGPDASVASAAADEASALRRGKELLISSGVSNPVVATGSTPTARLSAMYATANVLRPGNYVFHDAIQVALGVVPPERCALTVLTTVLCRQLIRQTSGQQRQSLIVDAGSKCLGLDKGAHGSSLVRGHGIVLGHPHLEVSKLSEEVGIIEAIDRTEIKVGDTVRIVPNHSCSAANLTSYLVGHRGDKIEEMIPIDMRGGSRRRA